MTCIVSRVGDWAVVADNAQWMLQRFWGRKWYTISYVRSTRDVFARCMQEAGAPPEVQAQLLEGIPSTFDQWRLETNTSQRGVADGEGSLPHQRPDDKTHRGYL